MLDREPSFCLLLASIKDSRDIQEVMQTALDGLGCRETSMIKMIGGFPEDDTSECKGDNKDD